MKLIALKIDVDTCRGALEGVPRLLSALQSRQAKASFLFGLGPDRAGREWRAILASGWRSRGKRISLIEHLGWRTCLSGTLMPARNMGLRCAAVMQSVRESGHETGIRAWSRLDWLRMARHADEAWTLQALDRAAAAYRTVFDVSAPVHGAVGWQMNRAAFRWQQRLGLAYASDTRGQHPFWPVIDGEPVRCLQLPTTLPTLQELVRSEGLDEDGLLERLLRATADELANGHVFTLSAEFEGMKWLPLFERVLDGWIAQGYRLVMLGDLYRAQNLVAVPYHEVKQAEWPGVSGLLAIQGRAFPV